MKIRGCFSQQNRRKTTDGSNFAEVAPAYSTRVVLAQFRVRESRIRVPRHCERKQIANKARPELFPCSRRHCKCCRKDKRKIKRSTVPDLVTADAGSRFHPRLHRTSSLCLHTLYVLWRPRQTFCHQPPIVSAFRDRKCRRLHSTRLGFGVGEGDRMQS